MIIELWEVGKLKPYGNNPRVNKKAVEMVKNSIEEFGWKQPIVIDEQGVVICGHTRLMAAKALGYDKVPCLVASDLTPEQCKQYRIVDNSTADVAEWDIEKLMQECGDMPDIDFANFGLDLDKILADASGLMADDEEKPEGRKKNTVKADEIVIQLANLQLKGDIVEAIEKALIPFEDHVIMKVSE